MKKIVGFRPVTNLPRNLHAQKDTQNKSGPRWLYEIVGEFASGPNGCTKLSETLRAGLGWPGPARSAARTGPGPARTSPAQPSPAWLGPARPGLARFGPAWPGPGPARPGRARPHLARCNPARPSTSQNQHSTAVNQYTSLAVG